MVREPKIIHTDTVNTLQCLSTQANNALLNDIEF